MEGTKVGLEAVAAGGGVLAAVAGIILKAKFVTKGEMVEKCQACAVACDRRHAEIKEDVAEIRTIAKEMGVAQHAFMLSTTETLAAMRQYVKDSGRGLD